MKRPAGRLRSCQQCDGMRSGQLKKLRGLQQSPFFLGVRSSDEQFRGSEGALVGKELSLLRGVRGQDGRCKSSYTVTSARKNPGDHRS